LRTLNVAVLVPTTSHITTTDICDAFGLFAFNPIAARRAMHPLRC
jgi:hypothetical protein